jgi:5-methylcytosine-specific restriction enzyme A
VSGPSAHPNAAYPDWLPHPAVPVTVIVGPPGNGAAGYAATRATPGEVIIDLSAIITEISGQHSAHADGQWVIAAFGRRNADLAALARPADGVTGAWLIAPAPMQWQRDFWSRVLGARIVLLDPGKQAALLGAVAEGVATKWVHRWYSEAQDAAAGLLAPSTPAPRPAASGGPQRARESASARGYGKGSDGRSHAVLRDQQLLREPWCRFCWQEHKIKTPATVLDHIKPFRTPAGDFDGKLWGDPTNHRSLCKPCHDARGAQRNRPEKPAGAGGDGRPMDPAHPWNRSKN